MPPKLTPGKLDFATLIYCRDGSSIKARMFAPLDGVPEDPATGSAAAALTAYLAMLEGQSLTLDIAQGVEMGRPSKIVTRAEVSKGQVHSVSVAGRAIKMAEGKLSLP